MKRRDLLLGLSTGFVPLPARPAPMLPQPIRMPRNIQWRGNRLSFDVDAQATVQFFADVRTGQVSLLRHPREKLPS
jgi:hypothetical protein